MDLQTSHLAAALMASPSPMTKGPDFLNKMPFEKYDADKVDTKTDVELVEDDKTGVGSGDELYSDEESGLQSGIKPTGRCVTLQMLLEEEMLKPGKGNMIIEYLGQKFIGDLLPDGKIKSQETETVFCSPSAWAIHCKRIINPEKRSGCGWASVKYNGKKLDTIKAMYLRRKQIQRETVPTDEELDIEMDMPREPPPQRTIYKHNTINSRMIQHDMNTLVESVPFSVAAKVQPFNLSINSNALLLLDLHCHMKTEEVSGYLAGSWDFNNHKITISHVFPCLISKNETIPLVLVEADIQNEMESLNLIPVGWYHSHPTNPAVPSLQDCDKQHDFQMKMKGPIEQTYTPVVGIICSPYNKDSITSESSMICYYCLPPPEQRPAEYPRPLTVQYTITSDTHLTNHSMDQIKKIIKFYLKYKDESCVKFQSNINHETTFLQKLNNSLKSKFPKGQSDGLLWHFIKDELGCSTEGDDKIDLDALLAVPQPIPVQKSSPQPTAPTVASTLSENIAKKPKEPKETSTNNDINSLLDMTTRLVSPFSGTDNSTSLGLPAFPTRLDMLTSMAGSLGSTGLSMPSTGLDSYTANKLLSDLTASLPANMSSTYAGNKMIDSALYAHTLQSIAAKNDNSNLSSLTNTLAGLPTGMNPNMLMNPMELADALYSQRKYSGSLLGMPDPLSKSTLAANNMFLSPALFNLSESLLKPPSTSSKSHGISKKSSLYKNLKDYFPPEYSISAYDRKYDSDSSNGTAEIHSKSRKSKYSHEEAQLSDLAKGNSYLTQMLEMSKASSFKDTDYSLEALKLMKSFNPNAAHTLTQATSNSKPEIEMTNYSKLNNKEQKTKYETECDLRVSKAADNTG